MSISRRKLMTVSGAALAGLSVVGGQSKRSEAQQAGAEVENWPDSLVEQELRAGFPADLPLLADGSAPEHEPSEAGPIEGPLMWRTPDRQTPTYINPDYRQMAIRVDTRGMGRLRGTLRFRDLDALPEVTQTYLLQCGAPVPRGIVSWTGVRFADFADMLGLNPGVHYCRFTAADGHYVDEDLTTLTRSQVMLAWGMNGDPIPADHGAPLRLVIPFRYGNRSIKAITSMLFSTPGLPPPA